MTFDALRNQLLDAAAAFSGSPAALDGILTGIVDDVDRALREELEIFPVCHHSPASALAMIRRLREKQPKVVYLELCEDLRPLLDELRNCRLPVAVQAFASDLDGFPKDWSPLSVVAPITEASAEYQAIAYALDTPGVELVLVDRSVDHVFQWEPRREEPTEKAEEEEEALHGDAVGIEIGDLRPGFAALEEHLLRHGKVRHWSEWWDQYVEQPLGGADYATYRQAMVLIGSLFRRLGTDRPHKVRVDEDRERYMWTRMREHLARSGVDRADCLYVCGAYHAASRVAEFGTVPNAPASAGAGPGASEASPSLVAPVASLPALLSPGDAGPGAVSDAPASAGAGDGPQWTIGPRTKTRWLYGLIPSSHSAIEAQFGLASGSVSIAAASYAKSVSRGKLKPFRLAGQQGKSPKLPPPTVDQPQKDELTGFLRTPPALDTLDEEELLGWSVEIVRLARKNGYLASTADAIAVFETSILLAGMRGRARPTPYDFQDAAITCIEKDVVPGRRDVRRLCEILLGGDRVGQVGYDALPPLAKDVYDRLGPLNLNLNQRTLRRALLDLNADPHLRPVSHLLWMLRYLLPDQAVRPIMGSRGLGEQSIQESWDLDIARHQRQIIELGYEGVTVEQVLEQRLRREVWKPKATAAVALKAVEDATVFLNSRRFVDELGARAVDLLAGERTVDDAPEVLKRIRRLLAYYRANEPTLPAWCEAFVTQGYAHYCTLLPTSFVDEDTGVRQVAAMLGFLFSMESLALSLGCDRSQLELAVKQSHPGSPAKVALLWAAHNQLGMLPVSELRERCDALLGNPLVVPAFPQYLSGFVQALEPAPVLSGFVVELLSKAFARLPDRVLLPWLPTLITTFREQAGDLVPVLIREAGRTFPATLPAVDSFTPPWESGPATTPTAGVTSGGPATDLLRAHPEPVDALALLLGCSGGWREPAGVPDTALVTLLTEHPDTAAGLARLLLV